MEKQFSTRSTMGVSPIGIKGFGSIFVSITDGDIRRWLIKTGNLHCYAKDAMHPSPLYIFTNKIDTAEKVMNQAGISALPVGFPQIRHLLID